MTEPTPAPDYPAGERATARPIGRCINCFHDFNTGPCGGCGAVDYPLPSRLHWGGEENDCVCGLTGLGECPIHRPSLAPAVQPDGERPPTWTIHNPWDGTCSRNGPGEPSRVGERCWVCHPPMTAPAAQPDEAAELVEILARHEPVWIYDKGTAYLECGCNADGRLPGFETRAEWAPHVIAELTSVLAPAIREQHGEQIARQSDEIQLLSAVVRAAEWVHDNPAGTEGDQIARLRLISHAVQKFRRAAIARGRQANDRP